MVKPSDFGIGKLDVQPGDVLCVRYNPGSLADLQEASDFASELSRSLELRMVLTIPVDWKTGFVREYLDSLPDDDGEEVYASYRSLAEEQLEKFLKWIEEKA